MGMSNAQRDSDGDGVIDVDKLIADSLRERREALEAASRCGIREGETLAEFIRRLHDEANEDRDDT